MAERKKKQAVKKSKSCVAGEALLDMIPAQVWEQADPETYGMVNAAHAEFMGRDKSELAGRKLSEVLSAEETEVCVKANRALFRSKKPVTSEEWVKNAEGERRLLIINKTPEAGRNGKVRSIICAAVDITERARTEELLKYRDRFEHLLADISGRFINLPAEETDKWISLALRLIGEFEGVDRSYIFRFDPEGATMTNTHEWCASGIEPQVANLKGLPVDIFPWWMLKLKANEEVNIPSVPLLPPEARAEREILEPQGIKSLLVVPLNVEGRLEGFVGFDSVRTARTWQRDSVVLVRMSASIIGNAIARQDAERSRRAVIRQLEESEARWQYALEGVEDGVWDWDAQTNKVFFSRRWKEMLGYSQEEVGDSLEEWSRRVHPDDLRETMGLVQAHLDGKTPIYRSEHRVRCKDGSWKWVLDRGKVISRAADGKPLRVIGTHSDITSRKAMESELKETVAKLTTLMENMQAGLLVETPERKVMFANRKFCEFFGIPAAPEELAGADCAAAAEAARPLLADPDGFAAGIAEKIKARRLALGAEVEFRDGRTFSQDYIPIMLRDGKFIGNLWKYNDITAQKQLDKMRAEVTHHVNHELRRPITNQLLALDYLRQELAKTLTADQAMVLDSALTSAQGMTRMVEDLLEVTLSETGKLSLKSEAVDLAALAADFVTGLKPSAEEKKLALKLEAEGGLPAAEADPVRVRQILGNLADNAFKFTPEGGAVTVTVRRSAAAPAMAEVLVSDTGQGMDKADLPKIFDRLYQTANISRKGMKGLGLGLHICKMLVERQGGSIKAESEKGRGTIFSFTLPFRAGAA
jgi:PAS domain S-box-containing protein